MKLKVDVVTQEEQIVSEEVDSVTLPTSDGEITILPGHVALTALLQAGDITLRNSGKVRQLIVSPGFVQVADNQVVVLADSAVREEDLNEQKALEAKAAAEQAVKNLHSRSEIAMTLGTIERTLMEMRALRRRTGTRGSHHHPESR